MLLFGVPSTRASCCCVSPCARRNRPRRRPKLAASCRRSSWPLETAFIVTNLDILSRAVVRFYNKRGTAEQWIKEGKQAVKMTRLSCHRFCANEVHLWFECHRL